MNRLKESKRLKGESWKYYENWLNKKVPSTQENYLVAFTRFLEFLDKDTEELYEFYLGMVRDDDPRTVKKMGMLVVEYQKHLMESKGVKGGSTNNVFLAVKGFFKANELSFELTGERVTHDSEEIPNISPEQLCKVLNVTGSYKVKAFIKFGRDGGLRLGDITNLPIRVVRKALDDPSILYHTFEWRQRKTGKMANPVLGPDSLDAQRMWMNYRVNTLGISAEDGDPLFCTVMSRKGYTDKSGREVPEVVKGDWMSEHAMGVSFIRLVKKADLKPLPGEKKTPSFHSLRKFHKTTLEYAGVPTSWVNKMQGRAGEGTGGIYTKPNPEQLIEMYKKGYPALSGIEEDQHEKIEKLTHEYGLSQYELTETRAERDKYRAGYELRTRLQGIIDKARLDGWSEDKIRKLEELLQSTETFEDGIFEFHKLEEEIKLEEKRSENWDYEMVNEETEIINYIKDGWEIIKELNDGRCILRKRKSRYCECQNLETLNEATFAQLVELNAMESYQSYIQV